MSLAYCQTSRLHRRVLWSGRILQDLRSALATASDIAKIVSSPIVPVLCGGATNRGAKMTASVEWA